LLPTRVPGFIGPDLFNAPPHQGFITLTPSFTLGGEYNDNVFFDSGNRHSDGIFTFSPGATLSLQREGFRLATGITTAGQVFVDDSSQNGFGKSLQFVGDLFYQLAPRWTFTFNDNFVYDRNSNTLTSGGVSVGFEQALRNTATAALRWQATPNTGVDFLGSQTLVRFPGGVSQGSDAENSDTYRVGVGVDHRLTQRLTGGFNVGIAYIDIENEKSAWTFTPALTAAYDITPTLKGFVSGGPIIVERGGDTSLEPSIGVGLEQTFKFGVARIGYDRAVTAETIGLTDRQAVFGSLELTTLLRGLRLEFTPRYAIADTDISGSRSGTKETLKTLTLNLNATYQIARSISLIGSYTFFRQTSDRSGVGDVDQNRVFFGIQYAYPIVIY